MSLSYVEHRVHSSFIPGCLPFAPSQKDRLLRSDVVRDEINLVFY